MITIVRCKTPHALFVLKHLRKEDREEWAFFQPFVSEGCMLHEIMRATYCYAVLNDGVPCCIFGVSPTPPGVFGSSGFSGIPGSIWMLSTDGVKKVFRYIYKSVPVYLRNFFETFDVLHNRLDVEHQPVTHKWLKRLGFEFTGQLFSFYKKSYGV